MNHPRFLITTQSYQHEKDQEDEIPTQYGYLLETDFQGFQRLVSIPTPTDSPAGERIKPGLRGLAIWEGRIYVASWNAIHVIDHESFQVCDQFSHPLMADLHGLHVDGEGIVAASSLIDSVLFFDPERRLERVRTFGDTAFYPPAKRQALDISKDYRLRGKTFSGFKEYHANHVCALGGGKFLVTGRGRGKHAGHVALVDRRTGRMRMWARRLQGPHDGLFVEPGLFALTETDSSTVALIRDRRLLGRKVIARLPIPQQGTKFWTRGLALGPEGHLYIGQSVWSGGDGQACVVQMKRDGEVVAVHRLDLPEYRECRIFQIQPSPAVGGAAAGPG